MDSHQKLLSLLQPMRAACCAVPATLCYAVIKLPSHSGTPAPLCSVVPAAMIYAKLPCAVLCYDKSPIYSPPCYAVLPRHPDTYPVLKDTSSSWATCAASAGSMCCAMPTLPCYPVLWQLHRVVLTALCCAALLRDTHPLTLC